MHVRRMITSNLQSLGFSQIAGAAIYDLSQEISSRSPHIPHSQPPFQMNLWTSAERVIRSLRKQGVVNDPGINVEHASMTLHVGTHIDALGHFSVGACMHGGARTEDVVGDLSLRSLGAESIPPVFARGVLLDVAALSGGEYLHAGRAVTVQDLQQVLERDKLQIASGDVVLIRTGWGRFYGRDPVRYALSGPGLGLDAARFLTGFNVFAIGADNMTVEVVPYEDEKVVMPVHQHALVEKGVYLIENLTLDELAAAQVKTFVFVMLSVRFRGATACPVRPVALVA